MKYSYLCLEKEDVFETCRNMEPKIREYMEKHFKDEYDKKIPNPQKSPEILNEDPESSTEEENPESKPEEIEATEQKPKNISPDVKYLYRQIVEKTHPDKVGSNKHADLFSRAAQASKDNNLLELIKLASILDISVENISDSSIAIMKENITDLEKQILIKKTTLAWSWSQAKSDEERNKLVQVILSQR